MAGDSKVTRLEYSQVYGDQRDFDKAQSNDVTVPGNVDYRKLEVSIE